MKYLFSLWMLSFLPFGFAQIEVNGGTGFLKGFGVPKYFYGFHVGGEIPRSNELTMYARVGYYLPRNEDDSSYTFLNAIDFNTTPYTITRSYVSTLSHLTMEGGTRYYIGGFDNGFSAYGGNNFMILNSSVRRRMEDYDASLYQLPDGEETKGSIFSIALGLQGGLKYTDPTYGTFYFDVTGLYTLLAAPSNNTAANTQLFSPLMFNFSFGFRKEFY